MSGAFDVDGWPERLEATIASCDGALRRVHVVRETGSTQDAARRLGAEPGDVVVAGRQTAGRGRHGRAWADTGGEGVALTAAISAGRPPRPAIVGAVAAARAAERVLGAPVGIKWPNDIMVGERKLAGVLVEQAGDVALVGIGMNVNQRSWPAPLEGRAISLREAGIDPAAPVERLDVIAALLEELAAALGRDDAALAEAYRGRDWMAGRVMRFATGSVGDPTVIAGRVTRIDPFRGLEVEPIDRPGTSIWLDSAATRVLSAGG